MNAEIITLSTVSRECRGGVTELFLVHWCTADLTIAHSNLVPECTV